MIDVLSFSTLLRQGLSLNLGLTDSARLAGQQAQGSFQGCLFRHVPPHLPFPEGAGI